MRIRWLARAVDSKAYLREYNVVGVRWCMYSCNCAWIDIGKLNSLNQRFTNCGPRTTSGPRVLPLWSF